MRKISIFFSLLLFLIYSCKKDKSTIIETPPPFINKVYPLNNDIHVSHSIEEITWDDNISENVRIELFYDDMFLGIIVNSTESDGLFEWDVNDTIKTSKNYSIKIISTINESLFAFSEFAFTVGYVYDDVNIPYVKIKYPNGGETLHLDQSFGIQWEDNLSGKVKILLLYNGYEVGEIAGAGTYNNSFNIVIPSSIFYSGNRYKIRICSSYDYSIGDNSNGNFTLLDPL